MNSFILIFFTYCGGDTLIELSDFMYYTSYAEARDAYDVYEGVVPNRNRCHGFPIESYKIEQLKQEGEE